MAGPGQIFDIRTDSSLVVQPIEPTQSREISNVVKGGIALDVSEKAFVEKTLQYISSINGCIETDLNLRTNTKYPSRFIILISGLPKITLHDFIQISTTNGNIREITVNVAEGTVKIDVWRQNKNKNSKKKKRKRERSVVKTEVNLSNVDKMDKKCLQTLVEAFAKLKNVQTQFVTRVDTSDPEIYSIGMYIFDNLSIRDIVDIQHQSRTYCREIIFNFPQKQIEAKCLHLSAPIRRRRLTITNR
jgi:anti-anti-sigma regulatory factor|tara:strand:- start:3 stop:737 length:735 start_codon:yes stop_codon:yes gene_type:complete